jgi:large subunit ribosomal protein L10
VEENKMVAVAHYNDMTAGEWEDLRYELRQHQISCKVIPTKIAKRALDGCFERNISILFKGPSLLLFSNESTSLSKCLHSVHNQSKLELLGGMVDKELITRAGLEALAKLPSRVQVQSVLLGSIQESSVQLGRALQHHQQRLSSLLGQHVEDRTSSAS